MKGKVTYMMRYGFWGYEGLCRHMGFGGGLFMIGGLILLGLLIFGVVALARHRNISQTTQNIQPTQPAAGSASQQDTGSALTILSERYARGEINEEEYNRKKTELRK